MVSDAREVAVLQNVQQFGLQARVELGDLVQEKRAALGHFHAAGLCGSRAGEGALFKSEKLAFQQRAGNRRDNSLSQKARLRHGDRLWMKRARTSLPVPLSPRIKIGTFSAAARSTRCRTDCIASEGPK